MGSTNKTTYYELSQYVGSDKPTYLGDYNADMLKIDTGLHAAADSADTALTTANAANSAATSASTTASTALSTAQTASTTATQAQTTAETALTNAGAAQTAAENAETAARANVITNLAPAYDTSLTYNVGDLVTYVDSQGSGKLYKCIVAVTTPEAFNINKWDDVTTSEVYSPVTKKFLIEADGVKTASDVYLEARNLIIAENALEGKKVDLYVGIGGDYKTHYHMSAVDIINGEPVLYFNTVLGAYDSTTIRVIRIAGTVQGNTTSIHNNNTTITSSTYTGIVTSNTILTIG